jgi:hypothetical protein
MLEGRKLRGSDMSLCKCGCGGRPANYQAEYIRSHRPLIPAETRFWKNVSKNGPMPNSALATGRCWRWKRRPNAIGYSRLQVGDKRELAHRISYQLHKGEIPNGLEIDHLCRNRACVNPNHLEAVTRKVNLERGAHPRRELTHCIHGHPFSGTNLILRPNGGRWCRICRINISRRWRARHPGER